MEWRATTLSAVSTIRLPGVLDTTLQVTSNKYGRSGGGGGWVRADLVCLKTISMGGGCPQGRVSTEFRQHKILSVFFTSVYSVFRAELAEIPRSSAEFRVV